jgi:quercetin dioxygenase-like cupin family protein
MKRDGSWEEAAVGIKRRLASLGEHLMTMQVQFQTGAVGALHQHPHEQQTLVLSGRFRFTVGDTAQLIGPGELLLIAGNTPHGCECLEAGELLDTFSPRREDLLED